MSEKKGAAKKTTQKKHPGGRPTRYKKEFAVQAAKLCKLGATDKDLADFFGVVEQTVNNWKKSHPEFFESLKDAKNELDSKVERSLFERATGYEHSEDKIFNANGEPLIVPTVKRYPPDTTAAIFWLKNRKPQEWRDKVDLEHSGKVDNINHNIDYSKMTDDEAKAAFFKAIKKD